MNREGVCIIIIRGYYYIESSFAKEEEGLNRSSSSVVVKWNPLFIDTATCSAHGLIPIHSVRIT